MTFPRLGRDFRQLASALCLGIPLLVMMNLTGLMMLLSTYDEPHNVEPEHTPCFVCMRDEVGTLLLCVRS